MTIPIRDLMTPNPTVVDAGTTIIDAARTMRDQDIGAVIVAVDSGHAIVTDRDIVVRAIADGDSWVDRPVATICTRGGDRDA